MSANPTLPLAGITVVELDRGPAEYAGVLLSHLGARVIKVEPPEGASSRRAAPYADGRDDGEHSIPFWHYNLGKQSVVLDLGRDPVRPDERARLATLIAGADVLLDGLGPDGAIELDLDEIELGSIRPGLVHVIITPFGRTGPWRDLCTTDVVAMTLGGITGQTGYDAVGDEPGTPITPVGDQSVHFAGVLAATYAVSALRTCPTEGVRTLDVAVHDSIAVSTEIPVSMWEFGGKEVFRHTGRHASAVEHGPEWQFRCADGGYLCGLTLYLNDRRFAAILDWFDTEGFSHGLRAERFVTEAGRNANMGEIVDAITEFCAQRSSDELFHEAQRRALPWAKVQPVEAVARDPHLAARGSLVSVEHTDGRRVPYPRPPWVGMPTALHTVEAGRSIDPYRRVHPPRLGEDTDAVLAEFAGLLPEPPDQSPEQPLAGSRPTEIG